MTQIQSNKQEIGHVHKKLKLDVTEFRNVEPSPSRVISRWSNDEVMLAIQGEVKKLYNFAKHSIKNSYQHLIDLIVIMIIMFQC